jgi:hypothetical protein
MWTFTLAGLCMLSLTIWNDGWSGVWRGMRPQRLPDDETITLPEQARPLYLAPAALVAVILITN